MLGQDLCPHLRAKGYEVIETDVHNLDLLKTQDEINRFLATHEPELIVHCAAYTNVDGAETESDLAMAINKDATRKLVIAAKEVGAILVYISTDFVFDGLKQSPYLPTDRPNPVNMYGLSKYYGELQVTELMDTYYIIRTSWLYGIHGKNFVEFVLESARQGREIKIVTDMIGTPTWTGSLCTVIENVMTSGAYGVYHGSDSGEINRYDQARAICSAAGFSSEHIKPATSRDFNFKANRPLYSALNTSPLEVPDWQTAFQTYLTLYNETYHVNA